MTNEFATMAGFDSLLARISRPFYAVTTMSARNEFATWRYRGGGFIYVLPRFCFQRRRRDMWTKIDLRRFRNT